MSKLNWHHPTRSNPSGACVEWAFDEETMEIVLKDTKQDGKPYPVDPEKLAHRIAEGLEMSWAGKGSDTVVGEDDRKLIRQILESVLVDQLNLRFNLTEWLAFLGDVYDGKFNFIYQTKTVGGMVDGVTSGDVPSVEITTEKAS